MYNKRVKRMIARALLESTRSTYGRISIGAVIASKKSVVSTGFNVPISHPQQKLFNKLAHRSSNGDALHAELSAILTGGKKRDLTGSEIFVGRFDRSGKLANCKPCAACQRAIRDSGISRVYFTDSNGINHYDI